MKIKWFCEQAGECHDLGISYFPNHEPAKSYTGHPLHEWVRDDWVKERENSQSIQNELGAAICLRLSDEQ